ncbi:MAG TPA: LysE family transporter [Burkholderiales bacterium]|nr:LysE family transporter [Burkholderiales bacterium]
MQGFLVLMANPKALLWFGAFIPQFVDPTGNYMGQIVLRALAAAF